MTVPYERTFTTIGVAYTAEPAARERLAHAISCLAWQPAAGDVPLLPGLAIRAAIIEYKLPRVTCVAISSDLAPESLYGIECRYTGGTARVYLVDSGIAITPVASDFWPSPAPPPDWELPHDA